MYKRQRPYSIYFSYVAGHIEHNLHIKLHIMNLENVAVELPKKTKTYHSGDLLNYCGVNFLELFILKILIMKCLIMTCSNFKCETKLVHKILNNMDLGIS